MNQYLEAVITQIKREQESALKQVQSWKALLAVEEKTIRERNNIIDLLEKTKKEAYA